MPRESESTGETRINIEVAASNDNDVNSEYLSSESSNQEIEVSNIRWTALKELPLNLIMVVFLLGANESISIYLESLELEVNSNQTIWNYIEKGYTLGLASSAIELAKDFTAFRYVDKIIKNITELVTGNPQKTLEQTVLETTSEKILSFRNYVKNLILQKNQELETKYEQRINDLTTEYAANLQSLEKKYEQKTDNLDLEQKESLKDLEQQLISLKDEQKKQKEKTKRLLEYFKKAQQTPKRTKVILVKKRLQKVNKK